MTTEDKARPASTYEWVRYISRINFGAGSAAKGVAGRTIKGVAFRLSYWADPDGASIKAGPARIAVTCEVDYKTAKNVLAVLRKVGLLQLTRRGRGPAGGDRGHVGDEYRLTIPTDPDGLHVRTDAEVLDAIAAIKDANSRSRTGASRPRNSTQLQGSTTPETSEQSDEVTGKTVPREAELRGNPGVSYGVNGSAIPTQYQPQEKNQPSLSNDGPSVPAAGRADGNPRERDEEESSTRPKPHHRIALATVGITDDGEADRLKPRIEAVSPTPIRNPAAWWRTMRSDPQGLAELLARAEAGETYELVEARRAGVGVELSGQMGKAHAYFAMAERLDAKYGNDNRSNNRNGHQPYRNPEPGAWDDWLIGQQPSLDPPEPTT